MLTQNSKRPALIILMLLPFAVCAETTAIVMGDGQVDGNKIEPYEFTWRQCSLQDNKWIDGGSITEKATVVNDDGNVTLRHEQTTRRPDGIRSVAITWFDRESLAPLKMKTTHYDPDGNTLAESQFRLTENGYQGSKMKGGQSQDVSGDVSSMQYHGVAFGLPFATLDLPDDLPVELPASMISFDATYRVIATLGGKERLAFNGKVVDAWYVDVEWHHLGLGDIYPPGPDASGGRYWIVNDPPEGVPYVPRYKTDTYIVEISPSVCPTEAAQG